MVHQRQGLPLGLEAGDDLLGVHAQLDDLEGDLRRDRLGLLGQADLAHAAFAELLQQAVGADLLPVAGSRRGCLGRGQLGGVEFVRVVAHGRPPDWSVSILIWNDLSSPASNPNEGPAAGVWTPGADQALVEAASSTVDQSDIRGSNSC